MNFKTTILLVFLLTIANFGFAHNGEDHSKESKKEITVKDTSAMEIGIDHSDSHKEVSESNHNDMDMTTFSTLHPLIVHFPIVLLIILPFFQLVSLFRLKTEIGWAVIIITAVGFVTAYLASSNFHPHTSGLSEAAESTLKEHDFFAYLTVWTSLAALLIKLMSQFVLKSNRWSEILVLIVLLVAAYAVIMAGHHGSQLTHIYGVGPQGKFLEMHHH